MAKKPTKVEAGTNGKTGNVETADPVALAATPADDASSSDDAVIEPVADEPEPSAKHTIPGTIIPIREPTLAEMNAAAYRAHQEDQDFKKRKAAAAAKAMEAVLKRVN